MTQQTSAPEHAESTAISFEAVVEQSWLELGAKPISPIMPAGENIRLEEDFERIELEVAKLDSLTNDTPIEWELVSEWCKAILEKQSKDILVACYLTRALIAENPLRGMITGIAVNLGIVKNYWANCQPPKKRRKGRAVAYEWLVERCKPELEASNYTAADLSDLKLLQSALQSLDAYLVTLLEDDAPGLNELTQCIKRIISGLEAEQRAVKRKKEQAKPAASSTQRSNAPASSVGSDAHPAAAWTGAISNDRDLQNCYRLTQDSLRAACEYLRSEGLGNPDSYRINRFLTWLGIRQLPPANNGVTQLRPPPKEKLQHYESLIANSKYEELIPEVENSLSRSPYWLDGHRIVHTALEACNLNESARAVAEGVKGLIETLPGVVNLKFSDQQPFADDETKQWINRAVNTGDASGGVNTSLPVAMETACEWDQAYEEAMKLYREKKINESFAVFSEGCKRTYSKRELAFWRYNQARFCYDTAQFKLAVALLEQIDKSLQYEGYEHWEPEVSGKVVELLIRAFKKFPEKEIPTERVAALHERLCQFDLAVAYELSIN